MRAEAPKHPPEKTEVAGNRDQILFGGLLATCVGFLAQLADKTPEKFSYLWWASLSFAVAMPFLSTSLLLDMRQETPESKPPWRLVFDLVGVLATVVSVAFVFFNVNMWAGWVFGATALLAISLVAWGSRR